MAHWGAVAPKTNKQTNKQTNKREGESNYQTFSARECYKYVKKSIKKAWGEIFDSCPRKEIF